MILFLCLVWKSVETSHLTESNSHGNSEKGRQSINMISDNHNKDLPSEIDVCPFKIDVVMNDDSYKI